MQVQVTESELKVSSQETKQRTMKGEESFRKTQFLEKLFEDKSTSFASAIAMAHGSFMPPKKLPSNVNLNRSLQQKQSKKQTTRGKSTGISMDTFAVQAYGVGQAAIGKEQKQMLNSNQSAAPSRNIMSGYSNTIGTTSIMHDIACTPRQIAQQARAEQNRL